MRPALADIVLIKTGSGNGDLESSQRRIGWPGATGAVSVVFRALAFLTEIFGAGVADLPVRKRHREHEWLEMPPLTRQLLG